jgi:hypothetical protein
VPATDLGARHARAHRAGVDLGAILTGRRQCADGTELAWQLTDLCHVLADGVVPFLIDWGTSAHPARSLPDGAGLVALHAEHPQADEVRELLRRLEIDLRVDTGDKSRLVARILGLNGQVVLQ